MVSKIYDLAVPVSKYNVNGQEKNRYENIGCVMKSDNGKRSFKGEINAPEGMSYASDIAKKYGVTYEMLTGRKEAED